MMPLTDPLPEDKDENQHYHQQYCNDAPKCHQYWGRDRALVHIPCEVLQQQLHYVLYTHLRQGRK